MNLGKVLIWAVVPFHLAACDNGGASSWSREEKSNAVHFIRAEQAARDAVRISNQGPAFSGLTEADVAEILRLSQTALAEGRKVRDSVLEKAYPGMSGPFRELFMPSQELQIQSLKNSDASASLKSLVLYNRWIDWRNFRVEEIKIPK